MEVINLNDIWYELESNHLDWDNSDIKYKFCVFFFKYINDTLKDFGMYVKNHITTEDWYLKRG